MTVPLLIYEKSFARVQDKLPSTVVPLVMARDGSLSCPGASRNASNVKPEIAWASAELFIDGVFNEFMDVALNAGSLQWLQSGAAGYDHPAFAKAAGQGVRICNSNAMVVSIAELVLAGVLDHFQGGPFRRADRERHRWRPRHFREIAGTRWLIIGFGSIGREVAVRARAFAAHVTAVRRSPGDDPLADAVTTPARILQELPNSDVVVLSLPLARDTENMVNADFLAAMKEQSVIVNVARGGVVDEDALLAALDRGRPAHAVLDVFKREPLPPESPFWDHPQVTFSAHSAGMGSGLMRRSDELFLDNLSRYLNGQPLVKELAARDVLGTG